MVSALADLYGLSGTANISWAETGSSSYMFTDELSKDSSEHAGPQTRFVKRRARQAIPMRQWLPQTRRRTSSFRRDRPGPTFGLRLSPAA